MNAIPAKEQALLDCLTAAVREALERKRRLGQYAVVWRDGGPVFIGEEPTNRLPEKSAVAAPPPGELSSQRP